MQLVQTMFQMEYESQGDSMIRKGALRCLPRLAALQQWQYSSNSFMHSGMGKPIPSDRVILKRLSIRALIFSILANGEQYSVINSPLSGMAYTLAFFVLSVRQLEQRKVAMPPAETPVMTILSPLQKSNYSSRNLKDSITLLYPLKYKSLSLQEMGSALLPLYSLPSQQRMKIFVQSWNIGFNQGLVAMMPARLRSAVGGRFFEEPKLPSERRQQLQSVSARLYPPQKPPPSKKIRYLFRFSPEPK